MLLDEAEGADMLMVKPAGLYLDIIAKVRETSTLPVAAYQVSGEYLMLKSAAAGGWLDEEAIVLESLLAIKRAGRGHDPHLLRQTSVRLALTRGMCPDCLSRNRSRSSVSRTQLKTP